MWYVTWYLKLFDFWYTVEPLELKLSPISFGREPNFHSFLLLELG